jgi:alpha-tubulin suppressor-like RCC1 family protein
MAWGYNGQGQLGDGTLINRTTPVPVSGLANVTALAGGGGHSLALLLDGTGMAWGFNDSGQLGDGTLITRTTPVPVSGLASVTAIASGGYHSLALLLDDARAREWTHQCHRDGRWGLTQPGAAFGWHRYGLGL